MTGASEVVCNPISKAVAAGPMSTAEPIHVWAALLQAWKWLTRCSRGVLVRVLLARLEVKPESPGAGLFESVLSRVESSSVGSEEDGRNRIEVMR
jgi:hypothetical protein